MRKYSVESVKVHQSIKHRIDPSHTFEEVFEVIELPKSVDLIELLQYEIFVLHDVDGQ